MSVSLYSKVHKWIDAIGFKLNGSQVSDKGNVTINHYFFKTFNFLEKAKNNDLNKTKFMCFDTYGQAMKVKSLLDLQTEFFENISQLK